MDSTQMWVLNFLNQRNKYFQIVECDVTFYSEQHWDGIIGSEYLRIYQYYHALLPHAW